MKLQKQQENAKLAKVTLPGRAGGRRPAASLKNSPAAEASG